VCTDALCRITCAPRDQHALLQEPQRQWTTRGAHLLLHACVHTLHQALGAVFQRWSPDMPRAEEPQAA
jgi:hypothetical protein